MLEPVEADLKAIAMKFALSSFNAGDARTSSAVFDDAPRLSDRDAARARADHAARRDATKRLLLATDCLVDARLAQGAAVVKRYELCVTLRPDWARAYVSAARYFDLLLAARRREVEATSGPGAVDGDSLAHDHALNAMRWPVRRRF